LSCSTWCFDRKTRGRRKIWTPWKGSATLFKGEKSLNARGAQSVALGLACQIGVCGRDGGEL
jgi:hypothetical protein